eukprot:UN13591
MNDHLYVIESLPSRSKISLIASEKSMLKRISKLRFHLFQGQVEFFPHLHMQK